MRVTKGVSLVILPLRFVVYFSLSFSLIFLSGFLETKKVTQVEKEALFLSRHSKPAQQLSEQVYEQMCESTTVQPDSEEKKHYLSRLSSHPLIPVSYWDWKNIQKTLLPEREGSLCFKKKDVIHAVDVRGAEDPELFDIRIIVLGSTRKHKEYTRVHETDLAQHSEIRSVLSEMDTHSGVGSSLGIRGKPADIPLVQWKRFTASKQGLDYPAASFIFGNHLYKAAVGTQYELYENEIPGLRKQLVMSGIVLLVIGLLSMAKLYRTVKGVRYLPNQQALFFDIIVILVLAVSGFMSLDHLIAEKYAASSVLGKEGALGVFTYVPVILVLTVFVSRLASRGILINNVGLLESSLIFQSFMAWEEIERIDILEDVEFSGQRRSYNVLFLHAHDKGAISIPGNIRSSAKNEIKTLLLKHVPDEKQNEMRTHLSVL